MSKLYVVTRCARNNYACIEFYIRKQYGRYYFTMALNKATFYTTSLLADKHRKQLENLPGGKDYIWSIEKYYLKQDLDYDFNKQWKSKNNN